MPKKRRSIEIPSPVDLEQLDPALAQAMTIQALEAPDPEAFKRYKEDDLADLGKRDRKTVLRMAELENCINWCINQLLLANMQARQLEADKLRLALEVERLKILLADHSLKLSIAKWTAAISLTSLVGAVIKWLFDRIGK